MDGIFRVQGGDSCILGNILDIATNCIYRSNLNVKILELQVHLL